MVSIFSTHDQNRISDDYFLESGDRIRFFFEEHAFLPDGSLKQNKERSINKIGHALHDPRSNLQSILAYARKSEELTASLAIEEPLLLQSMYIFKQPNIGGEVDLPSGQYFSLHRTRPDRRSYGLRWKTPRWKTVVCGLSSVDRLGIKSRWVRAAEGGMRFEVIDPDPFPEEQLVPLEVTTGHRWSFCMACFRIKAWQTCRQNRATPTLCMSSAATAVYPRDNWLQRRYRQCR